MLCSKTEVIHLRNKIEINATVDFVTVFILIRWLQITVKKKTQITAIKLQL